MKELLKDWILPPRILQVLISIKVEIGRFMQNKRSGFVQDESLRDIHLQDRCFVIGLGSSINDQDLKKLKNEVVIGLSSFFNHKDLAIVQPNYYVLSPVFEYHLKYLQKDKFINWLAKMDDALDDNVIMFIHIGDKKYIEENGLFLKKKIIWVNYGHWNGKTIKTINLDSIPGIKLISESALAIAIYLGFKEIYMVGFDHSWYEGSYHYFDDEKVHQHFGKTPKEINKEFGFDCEYQMREHADIFKKYKALYGIKRNIFNANSNSNTYVDTFPKVKYEDLFKNQT